MAGGRLTLLPGYVVRVPNLIGGNGGGEFDHARMLEANSVRMGCGGMVLKTVRLCDWGHAMGKVQGTYASLAQPQQEFTTEWSGRLGTYDSELSLAPGQHVTALRGVVGMHEHSVGAFAVNALRWELQGPPPLQEPQTVTLGDPWNYGFAHAIELPAHTTVAGLWGRGGDSVDALGVYVSPALLPGPWTRDMHRHTLPPFKQQVRALLLSLNRLEMEAGTAGAGTGAGTGENTVAGTGASAGAAASSISCSAQQGGAHGQQQQQKHLGSRLPPEVVDQIIAALYRITFIDPPPAAGASGAAAAAGSSKDAVKCMDVIGAWMLQHCENHFFPQRH